MTRAKSKTTVRKTLVTSGSYVIPNVPTAAVVGEECEPHALNEVDVLSVRLIEEHVLVFAEDGPPKLHDLNQRLRGISQPIGGNSQIVKDETEALTS